MTAIFAFAAPDVAFIAADTKRGGGFGLTSVARKTQTWSDSAVLAQTGHGEGLQRLVGEMLAAQHRSPDFSRAGGAEQAFNLFRSFRFEYERHHSKTPNLVGGTLLVAELQH